MRHRDTWRWLLPWAALSMACSTGAHSVSGNQPIYLAQSAAVECESTVSCCLREHPGEYERCGAVAPSQPETAPIEAIKTPSDVIQATDAATEEDDDGWRDQCIDLYVACKQRKWTGNCHDCLRWCQGQKEWPFHMCTKPSR